MGPALTCLKISIFEWFYWGNKQHFKRGYVKNGVDQILRWGLDSSAYYGLEFMKCYFYFDSVIYFCELGKVYSVEIRQGARGESPDSIELG